VGGGGGGVWFTNKKRGVLEKKGKGLAALHKKQKGRGKKERKRGRASKRIFTNKTKKIRRSLKVKKAGGTRKGQDWQMKRDEAQKLTLTEKNEPSKRAGCLDGEIERKN